MKRGNSQTGFTLIELMVVVSIIGVLTAIVVPVVTRHLGESQNEAYAAEKKQIQRLVDQYLVHSDNPKFMGMYQYPIFGQRKTAGLINYGDVDVICSVIPTTATTPGNALGGTRGGQPIWVDNGDGVRAVAENVLNDNDCAAGQIGWKVAAISVSGAISYIDSRDYFIDFDMLLNTSGDGSLREPPRSAAKENCSVSTCTGSYIYYVDANGTVETLVASFPVQTSTGFQNGIFP